jgi:RNA polymerase sigma factor (sigma-70 family)
VDHDYSVLRQWRRECSLQTYLTTVISRVFLDLRNKEWGKAKPPAIAKRLGAVALMLWRLTHRARLTFDEAVKTLQAEHRVAATRDELWDLFSKLPAPTSRYFVDVNELAEVEQPGADAEVLVHQIEHRRLAARVDRGLAQALVGLGDEDRLILKLYFYDGMFLAGIARLLNIDQPRLYPRFRSLMATLRASLEAQGLSAADVAEIVGGPEPSEGGSLLGPDAKMPMRVRPRNWTA